MSAKVDCVIFCRANFNIINWSNSGKTDFDDVIVSEFLGEVNWSRVSRVFV